MADKTGPQRTSLPCTMEPVSGRREPGIGLLRELRFDTDHGRIELWTKDGRKLEPGQLDVPLAVLKRLEGWRRSLDDLMPADCSVEQWWARQERQAIAIARALQAILEPVSVKVRHAGGWVSLGQLDALGADGGYRDRLQVER